MAKPSAIVVSIPHRYDKNAQAVERYKEEVRVSIPHRYDKNYGSWYWADEYDLLFQSLIGTIKTQLLAKYRGNEHEVSIPHRYDKNFRRAGAPAASRQFQSLIGTIKTQKNQNRRRILCSMFQSLIGTIKTW